MRARARIGCSGWQYRDWKGRFYPDDVPEARWLEYYARTFDTVEINNSFYKLPTREAVASWRSRAPRGFLFAVKASRYLTHLRKLKDPADPLELFFDRARRLGPHLGPVLYQLPPRWRANPERLNSFLAEIPRNVKQVIEFREPDWYTEATFHALDRSSVALCLHDMVGSAPPRIAVGPFVYVRFHGTTAKYAGRYSDRQLSSWASWLAAQLETGRDVYAYFNNDREGHAVQNALMLRRMIDSGE
jgi:uncharacterized protein YecE (DUF72 family)